MDSCLSYIERKHSRLLKSYCGSSRDGVLSLSEVTSFLGSSSGLDLFLELGHAESGSFGTLGSEIEWGILLLFPEFFGSRSLLLVKDGKSLGDGLSNDSNTGKLD